MAGADPQVPTAPDRLPMEFTSLELQHHDRSG
jgi:hypothetical protein